jgi:hypothetical protein
LSKRDEYLKRHYDALKNGARHPGDERWAELLKKATAIVTAKYTHPNVGNPFAVRPSDFARKHPPVMVPADYVAVDAKELLGIEASLALALAERESLNESYQQFRKIFADGYAKSNPIDEGKLDELERLALMQAGRAGEHLLDLIREVRGYRKACKG